MQQGCSVSLMEHAVAVQVHQGERVESCSKYGGGGSGVTGIPEGPDVGAPMLRRSSELYALELSAMTFRAGEGEGEGMLPATLPSRLSSD